MKYRVLKNKITNKFYIEKKAFFGWKSLTHQITSYSSEWGMETVVKTFETEKEALEFLST